MISMIAQIHVMGDRIPQESNEISSCANCAAHSSGVEIVDAQASEEYCEQDIDEP